MAKSLDPEFGADFPTEEFEAAIYAAMDMAMPDDEALRPTFRFKAAKTFARGDRGGRPLSLTATPISQKAEKEIQVPCLVTFGNATEDETPMTQFNTAEASIMLFDREYQQVKEADDVLLGGARYEIRFVEPPTSLFDSHLWTMHVISPDIGAPT